MSLPAGPRIPLASRGISTTTIETQDVFHRIDARSFDRAERFARSLSRSRVNRSAPFSPDTTKLASSETEPPCRATSRHRSRPWGDSRGRKEDASHRLLQPTYDTCTRGPSDSRAWRLSPSLTCPARCCDSTSPSDLSALRGACAAFAFRRLQPRVDARLTAPTELRLRRSQRPVISEGRRASLRAMLPQSRLCRP
jgi:hypothetical protein